MSNSFRVFFLLIIFIFQANSAQMLWKVKGNYGGDVFLLGALDVGSESLYPLSKEINMAFSTANYLILERKFNTNATLIMQEAMYKKGKLDENETLADYLDEASYALLETTMSHYKLPRYSMDSYKPWVVAKTLHTMQLMQLGYSPIFSINQHFWHRAGELNKPAYSYEGVALQTNQLNEDSKVFQQELIAMQLESLKERSDLDGMLSKWQEGNDSYFLDEMLHTFEVYPEVKERLLTKRSQYLLDKVERYRNNKKGRSYFVVVGLEHLIGDEGIIARLQAKDINITRY